MAFIDFIKLSRPQQWYKNLVIFIAIFFIGEISNLENLYIVILGFISLCLVSSSNYIINDIFDIEKDKRNIEKSARPLASGKIKISQALVFALILFTISTLIAFKLNFNFFLTVLGIFFLTFIYTIILKYEVFIDIIVIAINFVLRAISGAVIINASISPWLIIGTFFLSLFLSIGKRVSEISLLQEDIMSHRDTLKYYTSDISDALMISSTTILIVSFALYSFLSNYPKIIIVLPIFVYLVLRYFYLVKAGSEIPRHPEMIYRDIKFFLALILAVLISVIVIYY